MRMAAVEPRSPSSELSRTQFEGAKYWQFGEGGRQLDHGVTVVEGLSGLGTAIPRDDEDVAGAVHRHSGRRPYGAFVGRGHLVGEQRPGTGLRDAHDPAVVRAAVAIVAAEPDDHVAGGEGEADPL